MNKRLRLVVCILVCIFTTTGCAGESIYSEREEEVIADYVAQIVFKHAEGYNYRLEDVSKNPFIREEIDETEESVEEQLDKEISESKEEESQADTDSKEEDKKDEITISQALGFDENIKVEVMKTKIVDDLSKGAYYLNANKGEKLLKVDLKITNIGDKKIKLKYNQSVCKLIINKKDYTPLMTALENDFQFLSKKIDSDESIITTLVYSIDEGDKEKEKLVEFSTGDVKTEAKLD